MRLLRALLALAEESERYWRGRLVDWADDVDRRSRAGELGRWPWRRP